MAYVVSEVLTGKWGVRYARKETRPGMVVFQNLYDGRIHLMKNSQIAQMTSRIVGKSATHSFDAPARWRHVSDPKEADALWGKFCLYEMLKSEFTNDHEKYITAVSDMARLKSSLGDGANAIDPDLLTDRDSRKTVAQMKVLEGQIAAYAEKLKAVKVRRDSIMAELKADAEKHLVVRDQNELEAKEAALLAEETRRAKARKKAEAAAKG